MNNQGHHYHQSLNAGTGRDDNGNAVPNPESGDVDEANIPNFGLPANGLPQFPVTDTNITTATTTTTTTTNEWDIFGEIPILPVSSSVETSLSPAQQHQHQQQIIPALDSSRELQSRSRKRLKSSSPNSGASSSSVRKRTLTACESCRIKKIKCDLNKPTCTSCVKFSMNCIYRQTNIEPVVQPTPIPVPAQDQSDSANMDEREEAMRDLANSSVLSSERGTMTSLMGNSNWLVNIENLITWDVYSQFTSTHNLRSINTRLVLYSGLHGSDLQQGLFTEEDLSSMSSDLLSNLDTYVSNYSKFVQDKNPFIDLEKLKYTIQFIKDSQSLNIFKLNFDSEMIPLPSILLICSCSLLSRPFDVRSQQQQQQQQTFRTSKEEKGANFAKSLAYFQLANQLQASVSHRIQDFDLNVIQFYLLSSTFLMLNMRPMQTWDLIHRSSIRIITILESLKSSSQKISQRDSKNIERFFFTCFKYESELRVELSPLVPSSGIIHYPFPALYPTVPPISGRSIEEQTSWFYYLTELSLRKLENRILDVFYTIDSSSVNDEKEGEFVSDNYDLNWDKKWTLMSAIAKATEFLADVKKIEVQMLLFLKPALSQLDQDSLTEILKPHGFVLKDFLNESDLKKLEKRKKQKSPKTPDSSGGSTTAESTAGNTPKEGVSDVPEVLNYIKTRMVVLKALLFRPILYHVYKMNREEILATLANNTFLKNLIQQGVESWDHLDVSLAKHRHYGSWFFLRHLVSISTLFYGLFIKLRNELMDVEKVKEGFVAVIDILNYWIDECPEFKESIDLMNEFLEDIDKMD